MITPRSTQKITDTVIPKNESLQHVDIRTRFTQFGRLHAISLDYAAKSDLNPTSIIELPVTPHGLASAIMHAYTLHQHLRFSPDDVWLTIAQGVSRLINYKAESFRHLFVDHADKKELLIKAPEVIEKDGNFVGDWSKTIAKLSYCVDKHVKVDLRQLFECNFSTTTNASVTASRIVLLGAMTKYLDYRLRGGCGIPKVTLDGTLEDWLHLQEKVKGLRSLGSEFDLWLDNLEPVIAQFVATYVGNVDEKFWSMVITTIPYYNIGDMTMDVWDGWIAALFPQESNKIHPYDIPQGLTCVPFTLNIEDRNFSMNFGAGFLGARQDRIDGEYVVSPVIGWYVMEGMGEKIVQLSFQEEYTRLGDEQIVRLYLDFLSHNNK